MISLPHLQEYLYYIQLKEHIGLCFQIKIISIQMDAHPVNIRKQIKKGIYRRAAGLYSEYQIQKYDSYCAAYCLYVLNLTQIIGFKNAVLNLYSQTFKLNK